MVAAIPSILSFVGKLAANFLVWEAFDAAYKKLTGKGSNSGVDGTIWRIGKLEFVPIAVYTIKDPKYPAYCILTMTAKRNDQGKRLYKTFMVAQGQSIVLSAYDPDLAKQFLSLGGPWTNMNFPSSKSIYDFVQAKGLDNLLIWI